MTKLSMLAIEGGEPIISYDQPHFIWPRIDKEVETAVVEQMHNSLSIPDQSGVFKEFENKFSDDHGKEFGLLFNSGTSALASAYFSLGLTSKDNIIVPDYTFFATASPASFYAAEIRFADCDGNGNVTADTIKQLVDENTKAIVVTHLWGVPCQMDEIVKLCTTKKITLIEDCSHAHGATFKGEICGSFGDISLWSLQGQKTVSGGEGGILLTDQRSVLDKALLFGHYGKRCKSQISDNSVYSKYRVTGFGLKLRAHPLAIKIALIQYSRLDSILNIRRRRAKKLHKLLSKYDFIRVPNLDNVNPSWYSFSFRYLEDVAGIEIDYFYNALLKEGCSEMDRPGSTRNISEYELFQNPPRELGLISTSSKIDDKNPKSKEYFATVIKLPVWGYEDEEDISNMYYNSLEKVCDAIQEQTK